MTKSDTKSAVFQSLISFHQYRSILCLNGDLPAADFFDCDLPIIAADGAANRLEKIGVTPQLIIGDLDSVSPSLRESIKTLYIPDQATSDYQKSLVYLKENNLLPSIIVGIHGGYLDHVINNLNLFLNTNCVLYSPPVIGFVLKANESKSLDLPLHTKISFIGIPSADVTTKGLKWELNHFQFAFPGANSCFNRTAQTTIHLQVHHGAVLVLIYESPEMDSGN